MIISEIDNLNVAFHEEELISELREIPDKLGEKYNFSGIQGLNLFLIEYFRDKSEKEKNAAKKFNLDDSFHSIALSIVNLIPLFYNTHIGISNSYLTDPYKSELLDLVGYVYYSKISFLVEHFNRNDPDGQLSDKVKELKKYYNERL